jgi:formylglycine-generating enzyme required for sulfatase activity
MRTCSLHRRSSAAPSLALLVVAALSGAACGPDSPGEPPGSPLAVSAAAAYEFGTSELCAAASVPPGGRHSCEGGESIRIDPGMMEAKVFPTMPVGVGPFALEVTEVSNAQYLRCVAAGACSAPMDEDIPGVINDYWLLPEYADHPVVNVTWAQANTYCRWIGRRLPTEYEWELVAGGALDAVGRGARYLVPEGATSPAACVDKAVNVAFCGGAGQPVAVGTSADDQVLLGGVPVFDLAGNVAEWVADRWAPDVTCAAALEGCRDCFVCREEDSACNQTCNVCPACTEAGDACFVQCPGRGPSSRGYPICLRHLEAVENPQGPPASESSSHAVRGGDYRLDASGTCRLQVSGRGRFVRDDILKPWAPDVGFRCASDPPPVEE